MIAAGSESDRFEIYFAREEGVGHLSRFDYSHRTHACFKLSIIRSEHNAQNFAYGIRDRGFRLSSFVFLITK